MKKKSIWLVVGLLMICGLGTYCLWEPLQGWLNHSQTLQTPSFMSGCFLALGIVFQIILAFLPGEPLEILAGLLFGTWWGTFICFFGSLIGSMMVYVLVKKIGRSLITKFFSEKEVLELHFLKNEKHLFPLLFICFLIPGLPKDLITYIMPLTSLDFPQFLMITTIGRLPSIVSSTVGGDLVASQNYLWAGIVFVFTTFLALLGMRYYQYRAKRVSS